MRNFRFNKLLFVLTTLALILAFGVTTSSAKKLKVKLEGIGVFTKSEKMKTDDVKGHAIISYEAKGVGKGSFGKFTFWSKGLFDSMRGYGKPQVGFSKITDKDGHFYYTQFVGEATVTKSSKGKRIVEWHGTWYITRGTGKWKHAKGKGKYKARLQGDDSYIYISQGVYIFE